MTSGRSTYKEVFKKVKLETPKRIDRALQETTIETIDKMIDRTPVETGAARYHWFLRSLPDEQFDPDDVDPTGAIAKARARRDVKLFKVGAKNRIWFVNSAPYFFWIEHGTSGFAPAGVVTITLAEMGLLLKRKFKASFGQAL